MSKLRKLNYLEIALKVVERLLQDKTEKNNQIYAQLRQRLQEMSDAWIDSDKPQDIYSDELTRIAYIYAHFPANANLIYNVLDREMRHSSDLLSKKIVRIAVFGCGPGTEVIGMMDWFRTQPFSGGLEFTLFELNSHWDNMLRDLFTMVRAEFRDERAFKSRCQMYYGDASDITDFGYWVETEDHDVYVFSYIISEIRASDDKKKLQRFAKVIGKFIPIGATIIYLDKYSNHSLTCEMIRTINRHIPTSPSRFTAIPDRFPDGLWKITGTPSFERLRSKIDHWPRGSPSSRRTAIYSVVRKVEKYG